MGVNEPFWAALDSRAVEQAPCEGPLKEGVIPRTFRPEGPRVHHHSGKTSAAAKQGGQCCCQRTGHRSGSGQGRGVSGAPHM